MLSHIVIATPDIATPTDADHSQRQGPSEANDQSPEEPDKPQIEEDNEQRAPPQKPPWKDDEDSGGVGVSTGNSTDGAGDSLSSNFSEAFNLKHLIYFENSSQNEG